MSLEGIIIFKIKSRLGILLLPFFENVFLEHGGLPHVLLLAEQAHLQSQPHQMYNVKCHRSKIYFLYQGVSIYVSTLSWTAIALDRLKAVNSPTTINMKTNKRSTVIKIVIINIISVLAILPYCAHMEVGFIRISYQGRIQ